MRVLERGLTRIGIAVFGDWARPWESSLRAGFGPSILAFGVGLRLRPVSSAAFRLDVAKRPDRKGLVFSAGVIPAWPR